MSDQNNSVSLGDMISIIIMVIAISVLVSILITQYYYCAEHKLIGKECSDAFKALSENGKL